MNTQQILEAAQQKGGPRFLCHEALHLTADGNVVAESHPAGRYVLVGPGGSLPADLASRLGLDRPKEVDETEEVLELLPKNPTLQSVENDPNAVKVGGFVEPSASETKEPNVPDEANAMQEPSSPVESDPNAAEQPKAEADEKAVKPGANKAVKPAENK